MLKISKSIIIKNMIESSIVKEVFLPNRGSCLCGKYFNDLTNSVLAFVREVQETGERHGFPRAWLRKFRGVSKHYLDKYTSFFELLLNSKETWFRIHHFVPDDLGG